MQAKCQLEIQAIWYKMDYMTEETAAEVCMLDRTLWYKNLFGFPEIPN